ncbi:MAG: hypothetical protein JST54_03425 [Deltaproteobacteria bacterium]|nr:hypothetical protein [Deltaproteobacteria bacterium]
MTPSIALLVLLASPTLPPPLPPVEPPTVEKLQDAKPDNKELKSLVDADQADRQHPPMDPKGFHAVMDRDHQRLARVKELVKSNAPQTANDFYAAALVLQHSESLDDYALARTLALESARRGGAKSLMLAAEAWDRWLMKAGYPQHFGTQYRPKADDKTTFELAPIDSATTDAERVKWGLPPLAEIPKTMSLH